MKRARRRRQVHIAHRGHVNRKGRKDQYQSIGWGCPLCGLHREHAHGIR